MISVLGHLVLLGAVAFAGWAVSASVYGAWTDNPGAVRWGGRALTLATVAAAASVAALAWALVTSDFSLAFVAGQSRRGGAAPYRLAGLWGGMAGSLLLWTAMVAGAGLVARQALRRSGDEAPVPAVQAVFGGLVGAFALVVLTVADPFERLPTALLDGQGLTPILEHPAMLYHPPLLYAGLTSLAAPFALTVAGLVKRGRSGLDPVWLDRCRRWTLVSWVLLAIGMVAGAHWAYVELGWGGYWAWDPVENTALLPWLAATAFLHARLVPRPSGGQPSLAGPALAVGAFALAVLGTMLTRSGAAPSVHAFAQDPAVGWVLLAIFGVIVAGGAALLARPSIPEAIPTGFASLLPPVRVVAAQVVLVTLILAVVLVGTVFPLVSDREVAVSGHFFATFTAPLAVALLALSTVGPRLRTGRPPALGLPLASGTAAVVVALLAGWRQPFALAVAGAGAAAAVAAGRDLAQERRPGHLAHLGFALLLAGVAGSTTGSSVSATLDPGASAFIEGYEVRNEGAAVVTEPDAEVPKVAAPVTLLRDGDVVARLVPELAAHADRGILLAETALRSTPLDDVQVILRDGDDDGRALLIVHVRPLVMWVWWGGLVLAGSGAWALVSGWRRRPAQPRPDTPVRVAVDAG